MKQIFSYDKYCKWAFRDGHNRHAQWATYCDGKEVINGNVTGYNGTTYLSDPEWEVTVDGSKEGNNTEC